VELRFQEDQLVRVGRLDHLCHQVRGFRVGRAVLVDMCNMSEVEVSAAVRGSKSVPRLHKLVEAVVACRMPVEAAAQAYRTQEAVAVAFHTLLAARASAEHRSSAEAEQPIGEPHRSLAAVDDRRPTVGLAVVVAERTTVAADRMIVVAVEDVLAELRKTAVAVAVRKTAGKAVVVELALHSSFVAVVVASHRTAEAVAAATRRSLIDGLHGNALGLLRFHRQARQC
jgi:hypothetical protein